MYKLMWIDNLIRLSWSILPRFLQILIVIGGIYLIEYVAMKGYPFELIIGGVIGMLIVILLIFFNTLHDVLNKE